MGVNDLEGHLRLLSSKVHYIQEVRVLDIFLGCESVETLQANDAVSQVCRHNSLPKMVWDVEIILVNAMTRSTGLLR